MPYFPPDMEQVNALVPRKSKDREDEEAARTVVETDKNIEEREEERRSSLIRIKNRRKFYLDHHPDYFSQSLELADPLLYDRCIRRFQSAAEREADGRRKGYSGILEADLLRSEAKLAALSANPPPPAINGVASTSVAGPSPQRNDGEINSTYLLPGEEDEEEMPATKEAGAERWRRVMTRRFVQGQDDDFDYEFVDENEAFDDRKLEEREAEERYFAEEEPTWVLGDEEKEDEKNDEREITGETGVQDF